MYWVPLAYTFRIVTPALFSIAQSKLKPFQSM
jgi:hypothetical protein